MCTNLKIPSKNYQISARCMDLADTLDSVLDVVPRNTSFPEMPPKNALKWQNQYGFVGISTLEKGINTRYYTDGMNEAGLTAGVLWLAGTEYALPASEGDNTIYMVDIAGWALGNFTNVYDVQSAILGLNIINFPDGNSSDVKLALHFIFQDANGDSLTVELMYGGIQTYINANGIMTNAPEYPWQLKNMSIYENLAVFNNPTQWWGQAINGSGLVGMPGDATPPSRFVRATKLCSSLYEPASTQEAVNQAYQFLQNMIVPYGTIMEGTASNYTLGDRTQWGVVRDHVAKVFYFFTAFNNTLKSVDLTQIDFGTAKRKYIAMETAGPWAVDVTRQLQDTPQQASA